MSKETKQTVKVFSRFNLPPSPSVKFEDASLTRQEFAQDADLNNLMRKYASGLPPSPAGSRPPLFGDFSNIPDYQTALDKVIDAQDRFSELPSQVRRRFDNDPGKLLEFLASDDNRVEAVKLGLIDSPAPAPAPVSVPDVNKGAD